MRATAVEHDVDAELERARDRTRALTDLPDASLTAQHSPLMSPLVWDMAHIANYEERWLVRELGGDPVAPELDSMYDAFENPRADRPSLPLLDPEQARAYLARVREAALRRRAELRRGVPPAGVDPRLLEEDFVYGMVVQHEHMHDETMLATRQLMGDDATPPAGAAVTPDGPGVVGADDGLADEEIEIPAGRYRIGVARSEAPWAFDNELAAHERDLPSFAIDRTAVTNARFAQFVDDDGYRRDELWSASGRRWRDEEGLVAPQFWGRDGATRTVRRFGRTVELDQREPVQHVCWYEAEAFATWAGRRLPTEFEWEVAASVTPEGDKLRRPWGDAGSGGTPANLGQTEDGPRPVGSNPAGRSPWGCDDMLGDVWEWTASEFAPYPGFTAFPYQEYSEVFWGDGLKVLRGGSWAVDPVAVSTTFRNWDLPVRRQIFAGFRCARTL